MMTDVFYDYLENNFQTVEGDRGVQNLDTLFQVLGYGVGYMRGRAMEEFFADNPGAVEAVLDFVEKWAERNPEWQQALEERRIEY